MEAAYPSGPWRGYWEQPGWGRQSMDELVLEFASGQVRGQGRDCIGLFTFTGAYDADGSIQLLKQYVGRHRVQYQGKYDGEGTIHGVWSVEGISYGPFALTPESRQAPPSAPIQTLEP